MTVSLDLHLHSSYAQAVSYQMTIAQIAQTCLLKGVDIAGTGDFLHPEWMEQLTAQLTEKEEGIYVYPSVPEMSFVYTCEIATIYRDNGKGRRIHHLIIAPHREAALMLKSVLTEKGYNLTSDGRPMLGISSYELLQILLTIDPRFLLIPAHIWTPWYGIYGKRSGYDSLEEAFRDLAPHIHGIETGISSDPLMNWGVQELSSRSILSFSDAHSLPRIGREMTIIDAHELTYPALYQAITGVGPSRIIGTIEFYPEEGKYHLAGHRVCGVVMSPEEQNACQGICPVCGRQLTDGVLRRIDERTDVSMTPAYQIDKHGVRWTHHPTGSQPPFVSMISLSQIIAHALKRGPKTRVVAQAQETMYAALGSERFILMEASLERIPQEIESGELIAHALAQVRAARLTIRPGYDGVYGLVAIDGNTSI
jgi:uncharacterized protein (TIGR00375 family)